MRKKAPARTGSLRSDLHVSVREAYRRAMAERRTEAEAYDLALAVVLERWPQEMAHARRLVAVMLATDPSPLGIMLDKGSLS